MKIKFLKKPSQLKEKGKKIIKSIKPQKKKISRPAKLRTIEKERHSLLFTKSEENPIILPKNENSWESWQTFNPGVILLEDKVHFLYRAIGQDGLSRFGYAVSNDGFHIDERLPYSVYPVKSCEAGISPKAKLFNGVYEHKIGQYPSFNIFSYFSGGSFGGAEDSRIVRVDEEDKLYMTYTACAEGLRVALTSIKVNDFLNKKWNWKPPLLISPPGEVHKNWVIFPEKINGKYAMLLSIVPEIEIAYFDNLNFSGNDFIYSKRVFGVLKNTSARGYWDKWVRGPGPIPIKTKYGWLVLYHAIDNDWSKYKVGAILLDLQDPSKILHRAKEPILEPNQSYENNGFKSGIVYVTGAIVKDGLLLVYYGGADSYVCVASAPFEEFVEALVKEDKLKLKVKTLKKK